MLTPPPCWTWLACSLGSAGLCGVPGAAPGPAPGGRTLAAGVADSAFGPRRSFCLGCGVSSRQRRGLEGTGLRLPCSLGSIGAHCVSPQSCTLSEDDSVSLRSRAASCITDSASEDALSIRSEMIQRKGAGLWGRGQVGAGGWGTWQEYLWGFEAQSSHGHKPVQGCGGLWRKEQLWLSQRLLRVLGWSWVRGQMGAQCLLPSWLQMLPGLCRMCEQQLALGCGHRGCMAQGSCHTGWTHSHLSQVPHSDHTIPSPNLQRRLAGRGRSGGQQCWASPSMSRRSWVSA